MKERWDTFHGDAYAISNKGKIKRVKSGKGSVVGKILKCHHDKDGYVIIQLLRKGKGKQRKTYKIHKLVADAFIGPCPEGKEVNHKDLNKENNRVNNLEYVKHRKNVHHAIRHGHFVYLDSKGENNVNAKLTMHKARKIRKLYKMGYTQKRLASKFDVSISTIQAIMYEKIWKESK